jgi:hypothetical protein
VGMVSSLGTGHGTAAAAKARPSPTETAEKAEEARSPWGRDTEDGLTGLLTPALDRLCPLPPLGVLADTEEPILEL